MVASDWPLKFVIKTQCKTTKARSSSMKLPHYTALTPMFMPVATSGVMKGLTTTQLEELDCHLILGNTYHLALNPGKDLLNYYGGLHKFMNWDRAMLTDSGGFQMVSLAKLMSVDEEGVNFTSHIDGSLMLLKPEDSMAIQNSIGADIIMQLDDVVSSVTTGPRVEEAMWRSIRWLDRCLKSHSRKSDQNLFPIIQGGLDINLRKICVQEMIKRDCPGYAIGGLSGGESKDTFWRIVSLCTDLLPKEKPIYCMGVGYAEDLVVCSALGVDMYDCVFPTRTARFGNALTRIGALDLKKAIFAQDHTPIEEDCKCSTCLTHSKSYIHRLMQMREPAGCHLISIHNIAFQMRLMKDIRTSIENQTFVDWVQAFMFKFYKERASAEMGGNRFGGQEGEKEDAGKAFQNGYPVWIVNALESVGIELRQ